MASPCTGRSKSSGRVLVVVVVQHVVVVVVVVGGFVVLVVAKVTWWVVVVVVVVHVFQGWRRGGWGGGEWRGGGGDLPLGRAARAAGHAFGCLLVGSVALNPLVSFKAFQSKKNF